MNSLKLIIFIGSHPDDPDILFGATALKLVRAGHVVNFLSANNGDTGHQTLSRHETAIRESQRMSFQIPKNGIATTIDVGASSIHPKNKYDMVKRLALCGLAKNYDLRDLVFSCPLLKLFKSEGDNIQIFFVHAGPGLIAGKKVGLESVKGLLGVKITGFVVTGKNKKCFRAKAVISGKDILLPTMQFPSPTVVRYAYPPIENRNLYNKEGLPFLHSIWMTWKTEMFTTENNRKFCQKKIGRIFINKVLI